MSILKLVPLLGAALLMSGCATLFSGDSTQINLTTSSGQPIDVVVDGAQYSVPGSYNFKKTGEDKLITTASDACASQTTAETRIDGWFWVDVILLSPLSIIVDAATGNMWTYDENVVIDCQ